MKKICLAALVWLSLGACAGYHIGPVKPYYLRDVHVLAVPTFNNRTLIPRLSVLITDTVIKQFQQDGTFRISNADDADAILKADIVAVNRAPARSLRGNVLATVEFNLTIRMKYSLVDPKGKSLGAGGEVIGTTSFFVGSDATTDERQAIPIAAEELAVRLVSSLTEGW